jgi:hypothetical protein
MPTTRKFSSAMGRAYFVRNRPFATDAKSHFSANRAGESPMTDRDPVAGAGHQLKTSLT